MPTKEAKRLRRLLQAQQPSLKFTPSKSGYDVTAWLIFGGTIEFLVEHSDSSHYYMDENGLHIY